MTRLLERLEHLLEHRPHLPSRRGGQFGPERPAMVGFHDCRGHWHSWDEQ